MAEKVTMEITVGSQEPGIHIGNFINSINEVTSYYLLETPETAAMLSEALILYARRLEDGQ